MRPTKYNEDIIKKSKDYLENYEKLGDATPTIAGLAVYLGISRETIYDWSSQEEKWQFSDTIKLLSAKQEAILWNKGLKNEFNPTICKLGLANHGHADKFKNEVTGANGKDFFPAQINIIGVSPDDKSNA